MSCVLDNILARKIFERKYPNENISDLVYVCSNESLDDHKIINFYNVKTKKFFEYYLEMSFEDNEPDHIDWYDTNLLSVIKTNDGYCNDLNKFVDTYKFNDEYNKLLSQLNALSC